MMMPPGGQTVTKNFLTCGQLRNIQRYQKYVWHVRAFFLSYAHVQANSALWTRVFFSLVSLLVTIFLIFA